MSSIVSWARKNPVYRFPEVDVNYSRTIVDNGVSIALNDNPERKHRRLGKSQAESLDAGFLWWCIG